MLALVKYNVLARLKPRRWIALSLFFVAFLLVYIPDIRYLGKDARSINVWDVGPCVLFDPFLPSSVFLLGFFLLNGDDLTGGRADGTLRTTLLRARSPLRFWLAKVLAWGVLACCFMSAFLLATIVASALCSVPVELRSSTASAESYRMFSKWYVLAPGWPTMLYTIALVYSTAAVLWVLFTAYMALSLLVYPSLFRAYVGFFLLYGLSVWITGTGSLLSASFFLSPAKHFAGLGHKPVPPGQFAALLAAIVASAAAVGYLRIRRLQV